MSTAIRLTDAQAETLGELINGHWGTFGLHEPFPARNNQDNGHRRTVTTLIRRGLINKVSGLVGHGLDGRGQYDLYEVTPEAREAYLEWAAEHDVD